MDRSLRALIVLPKTPIANRIYQTALRVLVSTAFISAALANSVASAQPLSEADVIRLARTHAPAGAVADATDALADARSRTAGRYPNPILEWARESVVTGGVGSESSQDIVSATLPIDIARPLAERSLAASAGAWMRAEASLTRTGAILGAVLAYYDAILAQARVDVLVRSVENLDEAARVLEAREGAGTASGYESTRLMIGRELIRSQLAEAQGQFESERARLAALLQMPATQLELPRTLTPLSESDEAATIDGGRTVEAIHQARQSERLAEQAQDRAAWAWLPTLQVGGGFKRATNLGANDGYGYALGVSLSIPLFDRGQGVRAEAQAQRWLSTARADALTRVVDAEVQSGLVTFRTAREELNRFQSRTADPVEVLLNAAQVGYEEGERTIVELLDAQRAQTEVAERTLNLLGAAKRAEARLRVALGDLQ